MCDAALAAGHSYSRTSVSRYGTQPATHRCETSGTLWSRTNALRLQHHLFGQLPRLSVQPTDNLLPQLPHSVPRCDTSTEAGPDRLSAARLDRRRSTMPTYHRAASRHTETVRQRHRCLEVLVPRPAALLPGWLRPHWLDQSLPGILPAPTGLRYFGRRCLWRHCLAVWRHPLTRVRCRFSGNLIFPETFGNISKNWKL